jgi:predicted nucleotidyltransferase
MGKGNFRDYLQGDKVKVKKYFYVLRPVLACLWLQRSNTVPPVEFETLVAALLPDGSLRRAIESLLIRKKAGDEFDVYPQSRVGIYTTSLLDLCFFLLQPRFHLVYSFGSSISNPPLRMNS